MNLYVTFGLTSNFYCLAHTVVYCLVIFLCFVPSTSAMFPPIWLEDRPPRDIPWSTCLEYTKKNYTMYTQG